MLPKQTRGQLKRSSLWGAMRLTFLFLPCCRYSSSVSFMIHSDISQVMHNSDQSSVGEPQLTSTVAH